MKEYLESVEELPEHWVLGSLCYYRIASAAVTRKRMGDMMRRWSIPTTEFMPPAIRPYDAWLKACGQANAEHDQNNGTSLSIFMRKLSSDSEHAIQRIVVERRDAKGRKLDYRQAGEYRFYHAKSKGHSTLIETPDPLLDEVATFANELVSSYEHHAAHYDSQAVRAVVRDVVKSLNAITVKDGLYFITRKHDEGRTRLAGFVNGISEGSRMHSIPLLNTEAQRKELTERYQDQVVREAEALATDALVHLHKPRTTVARATKLLTDYRALLERAEETTRVIGLAQGRAGNALEVAQEAIDQLIDKVGVTDDA